MEPVADTSPAGPGLITAGRHRREQKVERTSVKAVPRLGEGSRGKTNELKYKMEIRRVH